METLLWRQISYHITGQLKASYPKATWDFVKKPDVQCLLTGKPLRIRTSGTDDYNYAEVSLDPYGHLNLIMMTIESLTPCKETLVEKTEQNEDPQSWYELIGRPALTNYVGDLQARGHERLFISEAGEVFIKKGTESITTGILDQFPSKDSWNILTDVLIRDELSAKETDGMLELSWTA